MRHDKTLEELWRTAPQTTEAFHPSRLRGLPPAVQCYLGHALAPGALGWHFGTERFASEGEFFRCTLQHVTFR